MFDVLTIVGGVLLRSGMIYLLLMIWFNNIVFVTPTTTSSCIL
jgi:hypothetical protein